MGRPSSSRAARPRRSPLRLLVAAVCILAVVGGAGYGSFMLGVRQGRQDGLTIGYRDGDAAGFSRGQVSGYANGYDAGYEEGYDSGYSDGYFGYGE